MANKPKAGCFARLSKGIGVSARNTYPFATTRARSCEDYSDTGRRSLFCFMFPDIQSVVIVRVSNYKNRFILYSSL